MNVDTNKSWIDTFQEFPFINLQGACQVVSEVDSVVKKNGGSTLSDFEELAILYELAREWHDIPKTGYCFELGTYCGTSAAVMATALKKEDARDIPLFTIDRNLYYTDERLARLEERNNRFYIARRTLSDLDLLKYVCQITYDDLAFLQFWDMPIRLAFLDSDHTYGAANSQIDLIMKYVMIGGWVVVHDYAEHEFFGVVRALNEFIDNQPPNVIEIFAHNSTVAIQKTGEIHGTSGKLRGKSVVPSEI